MSKKMTLFQAKSLAQHLAFAPLTFQALHAMLGLGVLKTVDQAGPQGLALEEIKQQLPQTHYTLTTLLEVGLSCGVFEMRAQHYVATPLAQCFLYDRMTQVNMDFVNDVCYQGAFYLQESFETKKPAGLRVFGAWPTVYEGLSSLPEKAQKSWFAFDHFYSTNAFDEVIPIICKTNPAQVLDVGCNTGNFESALLKSGFTGQVLLADLPQQLAMACQRLAQEGLSARCSFHPVDVLTQAALPGGVDAVLMSQFLDCFSLEQIVHILTKARAALAPGGRIYILEPFWDKQKYEAAQFALTHTSLYFTAIANGNSKMYSFAEMTACLGRAGLALAQVYGDVGVHNYTLLECIQVQVK